MEQMQKKMTAPGLAHRKRSGETNPFEVNVSNAFEHYITWGLALPYPILKVQVIQCEIQTGMERLQSYQANAAAHTL